MDILAPESEAQAAEIVAGVARNGGQLQITGSGSKGIEASGAPMLTSTGITGILAYTPAELVLTARAGTSMTEIEAVLAENRQMLSFEPGALGKVFGTNAPQTLGGIAAVNQSGPRRYVAGAARDSLLGVRFVNGRGEIIKNGGQVMKNVTGLDLVKLLAGSWGSLGFLTEVSFKVLPLPECEATLVVHGVDAAQGTRVMSDAMGTSADVTGAAYLNETVSSRALSGDLSGKAAVVLRLEGLEESVKDRTDRLIGLLSSDLDISVIDDAASKLLWAALRDVAPLAHNTARPLWKISVPPSNGAAAAHAIASEVGGDWFADWQGGLVWFEMAGDEDHASLVRKIAGDKEGYATLARRGPASSTTTILHPKSAAVQALSERVRASMDPSGVFVSPMFSAGAAASQAA
ncbi:MAG: FAD-binding protein [Pseudomonadota bacterium]